MGIDAMGSADRDTGFFEPLSESPTFVTAVIYCRALPRGFNFRVVLEDTKGFDEAVRSTHPFQSIVVQIPTDLCARFVATFNRTGGISERIIDAEFDRVVRPLLATFRVRLCGADSKDDSPNS